MSDERLPPHLQIARTVTDEEYATAKWQCRVILLTALGVGMVGGVAAVLLLGGVKGLAIAGLMAIACERLMDRIFPQGRKMRTQRMKVYPELRDYRVRQAGADSPTP